MAVAIPTSPLSGNPRAILCESNPQKAALYAFRLQLLGWKVTVVGDLIEAMNRAVILEETASRVDMLFVTDTNHQTITPEFRDTLGKRGIELLVLPPLAGLKGFEAPTEPLPTPIARGCSRYQ